MSNADDSQHLEYWVRMIDHGLTNQANRLLKPFGLTRASWYVLHHVSKTGRISQKVLQKALGVESASMAIIVDGLVRKGWLDRVASDSDRRMNHLRLTPQGASKWKKVPDIDSTLRRVLLQGVSVEREREAIVDLKKCWENLTRSA